MGFSYPDCSGVVDNSNETSVVGISVFRPLWNNVLLDELVDDRSGWILGLCVVLPALDVCAALGFVLAAWGSEY